MLTFVDAVVVATYNVAPATRRRHLPTEIHGAFMPEGMRRLNDRGAASYEIRLSRGRALGPVFKLVNIIVKCQMKSVAVSEFKTHGLSLLVDVARTGQRLLIVKRGNRRAKLRDLREALRRHRAPGRRARAATAIRFDPLVGT